VFFGIPELLRVAQLYRLVILGAVISSAYCSYPRTSSA
jgi:hypothetical protein